MHLKGQVAVVHGKRGWIGRLVQLIDGTHWNHTVVRLNDNECMSAEPGGALIRPITFYDTDHELVWSQFDLDDTEAELIAEWARNHEGTPYSWGDFIAAGLARITGRATPKWLRRITGDPDRLICSQLCDLALQEGGVHLFQDERPLGAVTPGSFGRRFHALGWADRD